MKKVIIIGSGFGGLSLAIALQSKGFNVEIFEKAASPGGHAQQFTKSGYTFDMGPTLITAPDIVQKVFSYAGKDFFEEMNPISLDPFYRVFFHDGSSIDYTGDSDKMRSQLGRFNPKDGLAYDKFIERSKSIYKSVIEDGLGAEPFINLSSMLKFMPKAYGIGALDTSYGMAAKHFEDFRSRFIFSFHPLFIGGNPFNVPAIYSMISYLEKKGGIWYSKGGMKSLVDKFVELFESLGGKLRLMNEVSKIIIKNGKAVGVESKGEVYTADLVVSNADVSHTYTDLIADEVQKKWSPKRLKRAKYSMSAFLIYLGVKKKYDKLLHHNIILSKRYKGLIDDIFINQIVPEDFSIYVHVPSKSDPTMAPEGSDSIYLLVPVANLQSGVKWKDFARPFGNKIINFLEAEFGLLDLRKNIEVEVFFTPEDFQKQRNSFHGTPWGLEPRLLQSAYFRTHNRSETIENLYFTGAGTHPGAGLPGVMLSAESTLKLIIADHK